MGRLPFDQIDLLVVGELKNSGAGMDPNVIGQLFVETRRNFDRPVVTRWSCSMSRTKAMATSSASVSPT